MIRDVNIESVVPLSSPMEIIKELPINDKIEKLVEGSRAVISDILKGKDKRFLVVVGPCSIHDSALAIDYAKKLKELADKVSDKIFIVMRVYFEKPRTTVGWKGFINDPDLNDSFNIEKGLRLARKLLIEISDIGLPIGTEALDPITPQYIDDLISWTAIGARTVESQKHREMSSGLSSPVGFKNGTDGSIEVMVNALLSVEKPHAFLGVNHDGRVSTFVTKGNTDTHAILRGGGGKPNYDSSSIKLCTNKLEASGLHPKLLVDCSHGNSNKDYKRQANVFNSVLGQRINGNEDICGVMIESNLNEGNQSITLGEELKYGVSVTDACISFEETEDILLKALKDL